MLPGIGVFGTGDIVQALVPFLRTKGFCVEAIWGRTLDAAERVASELNVKFYTNKVDDVLLRKGVDLVFIICQPDLHAQIAVKALGIGKHVLCDRPAGLCQLEVLKMVHAAQYYPTLISVISHGLRFLPAFIHMKRKITDGYVGKVNVCDIRVQCGSMIGSHFDWMCSQLMGGGVLTMIGSHIIDIISFVVGQRAVRVHGMMRTFTKGTDKINGIRWIDSDDFCTFQMILDKGACVTATLNTHIQGSFTQEIIICGTKGRLVVRGSSLFGCQSNSLKEELLYEDTQSPTTNFINNSLSKARLNSLLPNAYIQGLFRMVTALKDAFDSGESEQGWLKEPVSSAATFEDGQYVQAVIDAIKLSSSSRQWEQVMLAHEESELNPLMARLNLPNINQSSLEALSRASTSRVQVPKKGGSVESHLLWGFGSNKH
ncbi:Glucose-fructose oxidoreductase domain-containing protein 1 [Armadillidium nasatum]|uniref:Glucose-fructose oxidoreductase domain-containing protein 1 n=1 Tax=Armadillidium nasatum TaxID=96803 RepID=A0A5N5TIF1_9CRUS|nr:Glucose-fructose oxidoreductase domain-containing protein 1 [Armadillidium nasatum]